MVASREATAAALPAVGELRVEGAVESMTSWLRSAILSGETEPGTLLPTERDLAQQSGLSRGSVRQALQALAAEGLVSAKVGRNGGYLVQRPPRDSIVRSLDVFIRGRRIHHDSLLEVREVMEPRCAALAAERGDPAAVAALRTLTGRMAEVTDDIQSFLDLNIDWHVAVAEASGNEVFASIMAATSANLRSLIAIADYRTIANMHHAQHLHEVVLAAIEAQDPVAAERRMRRHIDAASQVVGGAAEHARPARKQVTTKRAAKTATRTATNTAKKIAPKAAKGKTNR